MGKNNKGRKIYYRVPKAKGGPKKEDGRGKGKGKVQAQAAHQARAPTGTSSSAPGSRHEDSSSDANMYASMKKTFGSWTSQKVAKRRRKEERENPHKKVPRVSALIGNPTRRGTQVPIGGTREKELQRWTRESQDDSDESMDEASVSSEDVVVRKSSVDVDDKLEKKRAKKKAKILAKKNRDDAYAAARAEAIANEPTQDEDSNSADSSRSFNSKSSHTSNISGSSRSKGSDRVSGDSSSSQQGDEMDAESASSSSAAPPRAAAKPPPAKPAVATKKTAKDAKKAAATAVSVAVVQNLKGLNAGEAFVFDDGDWADHPEPTGEHGSDNQAAGVSGADDDAGFEVVSASTPQRFNSVRASSSDESSSSGGSSSSSASSSNNGSDDGGNGNGSSSSDGDDANSASGNHSDDDDDDISGASSDDGESDSAPKQPATKAGAKKAPKTVPRVVAHKKGAVPQPQRTEKKNKDEVVRKKTARASVSSESSVDAHGQSKGNSARPDVAEASMSESSSYSSSSSSSNSADPTDIGSVLSREIPAIADVGACTKTGCRCKHFNSSDWSRVVHISEARCAKCKHDAICHAVKTAPLPDYLQDRGGFLVNVAAVYRGVKAARICLARYKSVMWCFAILDAYTPFIQSLEGEMGKGRSGKSKLKHKLVTDLQDTLAGMHGLRQTDAEQVSDSLILEIVCLLDSMYFNLYYYVLVACPNRRPSRQVLLGAPLPPIDPPASYFKAVAPLGRRAARELRKRFLQSVDPVTKKRLLPWLSDKRGQQEKSQLADIDNPLLELYRLRFDETLALLWDKGIGGSGEMDLLVKHSAGSKKTKVKRPCFHELKLWRDNLRDWTCRLYAFAVPNRQALGAIKSCAPILEVGAGTGYWVHLLRELGVEVIAVDSHPTGHDQVAGMNDYHGQVPPFTDVLQGGPEAATNVASSTLFLCYPPPDTSMALEALTAYAGNKVVVVGEWDGDTGTTEFERQLLGSFNLKQVVDLPNWSNTAYSLTIWKRQDSTQSKAKPSSSLQVRPPGLQCALCHRTQQTVHLRRCRYCHEAIYCSAKCEERHRPVHVSNHQWRVIPFDRYKLSFNNPADFEIMRKGLYKATQ